MASDTPETESGIVKVLDEKATRTTGSNVTAVYRRYVSPELARKLERERNEARALSARFLRALKNLGFNLSGDKLPWED